MKCSGSPQILVSISGIRTSNGQPVSQSSATSHIGPMSEKELYIHDIVTYPDMERIP